MSLTFRTTRRLAVALLATAALGALAACSSGSPASAGAPTESTTRVVSTAKGDVTVPTHPKRVVSVQSWTTESLIDLGITPVAVEDPGEEYVPGRYLDVWKGADKVTSGADIDFEKIAALKPDLIVGVDVPYLDSAYAKLSAIAPTAFVAWDNTKPWSNYPQATADFVNRDAALAKLEKQYEDKLAEVKAKYATELADTKWDVIQGGFDAGNYWIYSEDASAAGQVLTALGAQFASATSGVAAADTTKSVSYEQADLLSDADAIIYYQNSDGSPANNIDKLFALPAWKRLPAVQSDSVVGTPDFLAGSYQDFLGLLGSIEDYLAKAAQR
jgi:iron complex transport system substrate-binding protein